MKKQLTAGILALALLLAAALPALAHGMTMVAAVSYQGGELTLRPLDPYMNAVPGAKVTAAAGLPGKRPGRAVKLAEGPEGTYRGSLNLQGTNPYEVTIEVTVGTELYRRIFDLNPGNSMAETLLPMVPIEPEPGFKWGTVLYGAAVLLVIAATAVAYLRSRAGGGPDAEEEEA